MFQMDLEKAEEPEINLPLSGVSGAMLGITDKMGARSPAPSPHSTGTDPRDEGVRPCNSDLSFPLLG